jgi:hypothetical protein
VPTELDLARIHGPNQAICQSLKVLAAEHVTENTTNDSADLRSWKLSMNSIHGGLITEGLFCLENKIDYMILTLHCYQTDLATANPPPI